MRDLMIDTDQVFSLDRYIVETKLFSTRLTFYDGSGNVVLREAKGLFSGMKIETLDGNLVYTITHKTLSMPTTYEIHQGDKKGAVLGYIRFNFNIAALLGGGKEIEILDASQSPIGKAVGDFFNYNFNILDQSGNAAASIKRSASGSLANKFSQAIHSTYEINIQSRSVPTNMVLGFAVVLEEVLKSNNNRSGFGGGGIAGAMGGFGGPGGGFGGQGMGGGIKL